MAMKRLTLVTILFLHAGAATAADTASWAKWEGTTGTFAQNGSTIGVTYTGQWNSIDHVAAVFDDVPTSFTNSAVTNTPMPQATILCPASGRSDSITLALKEGSCSKPFQMRSAVVRSTIWSPIDAGCISRQAERSASANGRQYITPHRTLALQARSTTARRFNNWTVRGHRPRLQGDGIRKFNLRHNRQVG